MATNSFTAASLALGAAVISLAAPAARADVYDSFGFHGNCDSGSVALRGPNGEVEAGGRDCRKARKWASKEASRNRRHETQSQLLGLGGNLVTGLILNSQQQQQQQQQEPQPVAPSEAELALMKQQQEIELLKLQLQLQAPARAQTDPMAPKRALNLARDTAIRINGGLSNYRPGRCMYKGIANNPCLAQRDASGFIFHFPGGQPGWQESGTPPSQVTVLRVSPDGRVITQTIYNGSLTHPATPGLRP